MNNYSQIPLSSLTPQFNAWSSLLNQKTLGNIYFLKNTGIIPRAMQFANYHKQTYKQNVRIFDPDAELSADPFSFTHKLSSINTPTILIARDHFLQPDGVALEHILQAHYYQQAHGMLIFHECAPHELTSTPNHEPCLYLNQHLYQLPTDISDLQVYIKNIQQLWDVKLTTDQVKSILSYCGNIPWLINEAIRLAQNSHPISQVMSTAPSLQSRATRVFSDLPLAHRHYLLYTQRDNSPSQTELTTFGLLDSQSQPRGLWLHEQIKRYQNNLLQLSPDKVEYDQRDLTPHFTPAERRVLTLANHPQQTTSRFDIAQLIYHTQDPDYSDWALSQTISRLRAKLTKYKLPLRITPQRGQGYVVCRI